MRCVIVDVMEQLAAWFSAGIRKVLLERMVAAAAAAPGNATNTVVIRGRKVSRREV